jgi:hypothetical protein
VSTGAEIRGVEFGAAALNKNKFDSEEHADNEICRQRNLIVLVCFALVAIFPADYYLPATPEKK